MAGNQKRAGFMHLVKAMNAGGGFFGNTAPVFDDIVPAGFVFGVDLFQKVFDDLLFFVAGRGVDPVAAVFEFVAFVDEERGIAAVVDDELRSEAAGMGQSLVGTPPVFFEGFTFPCKDRNAGPHARQDYCTVTTGPSGAWTPLIVA